MIGSAPLRVLTARCAWCVRGGTRCDVSPVHIQVTLTLNVAERRTVGTECNSLLMLFLCIGRTCLGHAAIPEC